MCGRIHSILKNFWDHLGEIVDAIEVLRLTPSKTLDSLARIYHEQVFIT